MRISYWSSDVCSSDLAGLSDRPGADSTCDVDAVAATSGPGPVGALLVGVSAAKSLPLAWDVPFIAVHHLEPHPYAPLLEDPKLDLPPSGLLASPGHPMPCHMGDPGRYTDRGSKNE